MLNKYLIIIRKMILKKKNIRKLNNTLHRDLGYFFTVLIILYSISGIALNHIDDWNPDFIIEKDTLSIPTSFNIDNLSDSEILDICSLVGQSSYKLHDSPTHDRVKIYFEDASLNIDFSKHLGYYEVISKRMLFYEVNVLHRNSLKIWKWFSDIFALMLIIISITGLFVLKGKNGIKGRGKWFILAGILPPLIAIIIFSFN